MGFTGVQQEAKLVIMLPLQTAWPLTTQGARMGEAPRGGEDYMPCTLSLAAGEWQEPCPPISPISDASE